MSDTTTPESEGSGEPVEIPARGTTPVTETTNVILIPPLGLEAAAKFAEALAAIKEALAPKVRNALADALQKLAEYLRDPAPAPPSTPPPTTP